VSKNGHTRLACDNSNYYHRNCGLETYKICSLGSHHYHPDRPCTDRIGFLRRFIFSDTLGENHGKKKSFPKRNSNYHTFRSSRGLYFPLGEGNTRTNGWIIKGFMVSIFLLFVSISFIRNLTYTIVTTPIDEEFIEISTVLCGIPESL